MKTTISLTMLSDTAFKIEEFEEFDDLQDAALPCYWHELTFKHYQSVVETKDAFCREGLLRLGWTPPDLLARDALIAMGWTPPGEHPHPNLPCPEACE